jgi:cyanophycinase
MTGLIAILGSGEYLPVMDDLDRYLLSATVRDERDPNVVCIPAAAGKEGAQSVNYWLDLGVGHFEALGAHVTPARIIDTETANALEWLPALETADLIYFSGGKPNYLYETMQNSQAWKAAEHAWARGAAYAGCSAGAMILAQEIPNIRSTVRKEPQTAFGILPAKYILPHFDKMHGRWSPFLFAMRRTLRDDEFVIGIDEETALVGRLGEDWQVMGQRQVHIITAAGEKSYAGGETLQF